MSNLQSHQPNPYAAVSNARKTQARDFLSRRKVETTHVCLNMLPVASSGEPLVFSRTHIKNPLEAAGQLEPHGTYSATGVTLPRSSVPRERLQSIRL